MLHPLAHRWGYPANGFKEVLVVFRWIPPDQGFMMGDTIAKISCTTPYNAAEISVFRTYK
jgi:hypothetical protein